MGSGISSWSVRHPVAVVVLACTMAIVGWFSARHLQIDLLPQLIYPSIGVRVNAPGVPAQIMEDQVTRQLEEQLAITEDVIHIRSATRIGRSAVDLDFDYGKDMDIALRDAATRLDRAKRFLPDFIQPPIIYKRDPSQLPAAEYAIYTSKLDPIQLREWVDYRLSKWLINIPGVAAAEVAGGLKREIHLLADPDYLASMKLDFSTLKTLFQEQQHNVGSGRLRMPQNEIPTQLQGRIEHLEQLGKWPVPIDADNSLPLEGLVKIHDSHEPPRLQIYLNQQPAIKLSIQKQPQANTVAVVERVDAQLKTLREQGIIPEGVTIVPVQDEARHIRAALFNATQAAFSGAALAMLVVYLFLGNPRLTLIVGSAIPLAILVTLGLMAGFGLSLNLMTLGGLALGIGLLLDNTIVMLENIYRHKKNAGHDPAHAAAEVTSPIIASTSTNLAAVLPFLFIGGLIGLLFSELILTLSAAILASSVVALTLVPALSGSIHHVRLPSWQHAIQRGLHALENHYGRWLAILLKHPWITLAGFIGALLWALPLLIQPLATFLPKPDDGRIGIYLTADRSTNVEQMTRITQKIESVVLSQPETHAVLSTIGGFTFGRSRYESPHRANLQIQLIPPEQRIPSDAWIKRLRKQINALQLVGVKVRIRARGIRGLRLGRGDDELSFRVQGPELAVLDRLGRKMETILQTLPQVRNIKRSSEETTLELALDLHHDYAQQYGLTAQDIGQAVRLFLEGERMGRLIMDEKSIDLRLYYRPGKSTIADLENIIILGKDPQRTPIPLSLLADIRLEAAPATILREQQQRSVEINASLTPGANLEHTLAEAQKRLRQIHLPQGYSLHESGSLKTLQRSKDLSQQLMVLALFLVFAVMAVQYESVRNPLIIIFSVAFSLIGVALGLKWTQTPISMPVWLGLIMLAGIVVNNAIILVEYIELAKKQGLNPSTAIIRAGRLRLRPILMTTLTTVIGMAPLALGWGEGAKMLQPLAITLIFGLSFSLLVSLVLVPVSYARAYRIQ